MKQLPAVSRVKINRPELPQKEKGSVGDNLSASELAFHFHNYGNVCKSNKCFLAAVIALKRSAELLPDDPDVWCDLGASLWNYGDYKSSLEALQKSLTMRPTAVTHTNMGLVLTSMGLHAEAEKHYKESIKMNPAYVGAQWQTALFYLETGQWEKGLDYYECRMEHNWNGVVKYPKFPYPYWNGEDLNGKTIFVHGEQGMGDRILFSRYLFWLKQTYPDCRILHVTLPECQKLMWGYRHCVEFIEMETPYRDIKADYALFLMSLPKFHKSRPDYVPPDPGFIRARVEPDKNMVQGFRRGGILVPRSRSIKVGIRWSGNVFNESNEDRKIPFEFLLELAENPDVTLYSLQVGEGSEAIKNNGAEQLCVDIGDAMATRGYIGTALTLLHMDLVVTTCTSIAHLSGALGIPTWVLVSTNPYWVWLDKGDTTCWYPSVRLFRQPTTGDWITPLEQIKSELKKYSRSILDKQG